MNPVGLNRVKDLGCDPIRQARPGSDFVIVLRWFVDRLVQVLLAALHLPTATLLSRLLQVRSRPNRVAFRRMFMAPFPTLLGPATLVPLVVPISEMAVLVTGRAKAQCLSCLGATAIGVTMTLNPPILSLGSLVAYGTLRQMGLILTLPVILLNRLPATFLQALPPSTLKGVQRTLAVAMTPLVVPTLVSRLVSVFEVVRFRVIVVTVVDPRAAWTATLLFAGGVRANWWLCLWVLGGCVVLSSLLVVVEMLAFWWGGFPL